MNTRLGKSNCHSSFSLFLPSLLHYRQMTGQSCRRSRCCFPSIRHQSITSRSLSRLHPTNFSRPLMSPFISIHLVTPRFSRLLRVCSLLPLRVFLPLHPPGELMVSHLCYLFPLSALLIPLPQSLHCNQSDDSSSLHLRCSSQKKLNLGL